MSRWQTAFLGDTHDTSFNWFSKLSCWSLFVFVWLDLQLVEVQCDDIQCFGVDVNVADEQGVNVDGSVADDWCLAMRSSIWLWLIIAAEHLIANLLFDNFIAAKSHEIELMVNPSLNNTLSCVPTELMISK